MKSYPRVIVGISRAQDERALSLGGRHAIEAPNQAKLIIVDEYRPLPDSLIGRLIADQILKPGVVLVQSPYDIQKYAPEDVAELAFEREKLQLVSQLCQLLGATRVESDSSTFRLSRKVTSAKARVGKKVGRLIAYKGETIMTFEEQEKWQSRLRIQDTYPGGLPNLEASRAFVERHHLGDPEIVGLVHARAAENILRERTITVSYEGEHDSNLDIAAKVQLPQGALDAGVRRSCTIRQRVSLDLKIRFPDGE